MSLNLSSCANFRMVATRPAHQSFPENLYFGHIKLRPSWSAMPGVRSSP